MTGRRSDYNACFWEPGSNPNAVTIVAKPAAAQQPAKTLGVFSSLTLAGPTIFFPLAHPRAPCLTHSLVLVSCLRSPSDPGPGGGLDSISRHHLTPYTHSTPSPTIAP
ncbi:hypothetical protein CIRG_04656 [Coccidioides immitis RMSCC 2394]|uniref:Uncharacterized protein n=2 Tax=Coccidioides TaxID=5500 RepID=A0A0J6YB60_COCIT|nr:hypothetical protein CPAG_06621 [Coccidioides posadasii RMSCC 3488]KMP04975.1 hypothetical protein CIRG_04656 [Coccidioides immitis RMSCC 2394]